MSDDQNLQPEAEVNVPEWVPEKFRTNPEKFGEAYTNLERSFHETRQELATYRDQLEQLVAERDNQPEPAAQQPQYTQDALYEAYERDPVGTMAWLAQQAAQQAASQAVQSVTQNTQQQFGPAVEQQNHLLAYAADQIVSQRVQDWADYKEKVADEIGRDPDLFPDSALSSPEKAAAALERVYKIVKYSDVENNARTLAEQQTLAREREKQAAQTMSGTSARPLPPDEAQAMWEKIKNAGSSSYADLVRNAS